MFSASMALVIVSGVTMQTVDPPSVGRRPYELVWAHRDRDDHPPMVDFEDLAGWRVETDGAVATLSRSRQQQIWGKYVGKLTYRATGAAPTVRILAPDAFSIPRAFDAVTCWIYGNNWAWAPDASTPQVNVAVLLEDSQGQPFEVPLIRVRWKEWFLCHRRLTPEQITRVKHGGRLVGFLITGGTNRQDRVIYLDNLAVFTEQFTPLSFRPRPRRGVDMFPGQGSGANTGPGRLPFPTRPETILPDNLSNEFQNHIVRDGDRFLFLYDGDDAHLTYRLTPATGMLDDLSLRWRRAGRWIRPCVGGGAFLHVQEGEPRRPDSARLVSAAQEGQTVVCRWALGAADVEATVAYTYRIWGKSLVVDVASRGGNVAEVRWGRAQGLQNPRVVTLPYYTYGATRPAVVVSGPVSQPLLLAGHMDWCRSNASRPWGSGDVSPDGVAYNGGVRYIPKTNGQRNDCYERFFITVSDRLEEVLPTIPNPMSPWKHVTGTHLWRAHGATDRQRDIAFWRKCHRYGMTEVVVTDHETGWRDGGESFTFRTRAAPGKGGDEGQLRYARIMQDQLGFVYGPYNNFTDFAPVNQYWSVDRVTRTPDNQLQQAWARCYAPKPARAVEFCAKLAPIIEHKFHFSTAYCDVHTAVTPWDRTDFDHRVPGAGTFAAVFYAFGEIMLLQKQAWDGPVYSEGNNHFPYCGLTDGNYAQDQRYQIPTHPWLVDFDLRKLHPLCCNFGMGNLGMFYGRKANLGKTRAETDAALDRFLAATVAFGHPGFLVFENGYHNALRSYFMLQQLQSRYTQARAAEIRYVDDQGHLLNTTAALASGAYQRSQLVTRYDDGTTTVVNGHPQQRLVTTVDGRKIDLPPNGYTGWTTDGRILVVSGDVEGHRADYADTPGYLYVDGRGRFTRFAKAAGEGIGICRVLGGGQYEVIPYEGAECGFAVSAARATALDANRHRLGPARLRRQDGLTYVVPVEGALSYLLEDVMASTKSRP